MASKRQRKNQRAQKTKQQYSEEQSNEYSQQNPQITFVQPQNGNSGEGESHHEDPVVELDGPESHHQDPIVEPDGPNDQHKIECTEIKMNGKHATNGHAEPEPDEKSPLRLFGLAKDDINSLYSRIQDTTTKAKEYFDNDSLDQRLIDVIDTARLMEINGSIKTIRTVLSRNQMKVAFFGRTSNGKSTVINAILHDKVLPMGYGHTTGCFLQVQGLQENEPYLQVQRGDKLEIERRSIQEVDEIANALKSGSLESSTLVKIYWPINKCPLLKYDVVLVDSPGVDVKENLDFWIDQHCHDADVFILVSNAESTLNIAEKNFFNRVNEKLSKPNIFIVNNRWDSIADDPDSMGLVREQHLDCAVSFLTQELKIANVDEAKSKTFFVSAREALQVRSSALPGTPTKHGHESRYKEFIDFERSFEESLSRSAVRTKFKKHVDRGLMVIKDINDIMRHAQAVTKDLSHNDLANVRKEEMRLDKLKNFTQCEGAYLRAHVDNIVYKIVKHGLRDFCFREIDHLNITMQYFNSDFNLHDLSNYKTRMYAFVGDHLSDRLSSQFARRIDAELGKFLDVTRDVTCLLREDRRQKVLQFIETQQYMPENPFDLSMYRNFYSGFQEDLEFRFSLGFVGIMRKFQYYALGVKDVSSEVPNDSDFLSVVERFMMISPQSPMTVGTLAVGGMLVRTVGWRAIVATATIYGALYAYEYFTWTNAAKERALKAQYVRFARKSLRGCVPIICAHIADSIEQKMNHTISHLNNAIVEETSYVEDDLTRLDSSIKKFNACDQFTNLVLKENEILLNELLAFAKSYFC